MDDFCSLFPLQQQDGFLPKSTSFSTTILEFTIPQNQVTDHSPLNIDNKGKIVTCGKKSMENSNLQKKIVHRDFERQRRQEMAKLYESLRSVIPHELLKVKKLFLFFIFEILYSYYHRINFLGFKLILGF